MREMWPHSRVRAATLLLVLAGTLTHAQPSNHQILGRVAEEAEVLLQNAPKTLTQETLEQRALMPPSRFKPLTGPAAELLRPHVQVREVVSEYSVGPLRDSPSDNLVEFRQVVSVDGRPIQSVESARHALSLGMRSADEGIRKRMLENFARHGLVDVATDYGLILLAFTKRGQQELRIVQAGTGRIGTDDTIIFKWEQTSASAGELEFHGKTVARRALQGLLWARTSDGLPLRVQAWVEYVNAAKRRIRDEGTVEYVLSPHGFLTPASVLHRHLVDGNLMTENLYRYGTFKMFGADVEIKFTDVPDPPPAKK
jgi:hypothetical protein